MRYGEPTISRRAFLGSALTVAVAARALEVRAGDAGGVAVRPPPPSLAPLATFTPLIPGMDGRYSPDGSLRIMAVLL